MAEDEADNQTFLEKLLFYTTAFFVLLGIFSLFAFLFLVPFVIDPAFTTIFMEFEPTPVQCQTLDNDTFHGLSNCSWASCREGCTKEVFECTQIRVNYKVPAALLLQQQQQREREERGGETKAGQDDEVKGSLKERRSVVSANGTRRAAARAFGGQPRGPRAVRDYGGDDYRDRDDRDRDVEYDSDQMMPDVAPTGLMGNDSEWFYVGAHLFPNVKGCGYPPMLNCTIWLKKYDNPGTNFSCYYSKIDPGVVITELDMKQVFLNLVLALAIPIPSFIASVIYLTIAYFKIYNEEEQEVLVNEEVVDADADAGTPVPALTSGGLTPGSEAFREDLASFGHQLKVAMADEMSRESIVDGGAVPAAAVGLNSSTHSVSGLPPVMPATMTSSNDASLNKYSVPDPNPAPAPAREAESKATRPNALDLKLGAFV